MVAIGQYLRDEEWWVGYAAHLSSPEWQRTRSLVIQRCEGICERCQAVPVEQVHHESYRGYNDRGQEFLDELLGLCAECHREVHRGRSD